MTKGKRARKHNVTQKHAVTKKKKWVDMEMYRVPLNHEQAVLTCCKMTQRAAVWLPWNNQCGWGTPYCGPNSWDAIAS